MNFSCNDILLSVFVVCFAFFITFAIPVFADDNSSHVSIVTENGLKLMLKTDKSEYLENDIIHIAWNVTNVSSEVIPYQTRSTCHDGFDFDVYDSDGNSVTLLPDTIFNIRQNDSAIKKFDAISFYAEILELIKNNPDQEVVLLLTGDGSEIENILKTRHGVSKITFSQHLNFVTAQIQVKEIPTIVNYDFIHSISNGEQRICGAAIGIEFLTPNEFITQSFSWSQLEPSTNHWDYPTRVSEGHYLIKTEFNGIVNCLMIDILENESLSESTIFSCGLATLPALDQNTTTPLSTILPQWLKNNAEWWAKDQIDDLSFVNMLQYLIDEQIIHVPNFVLKDTANNPSIPPWLKNNAEWWAAGFVSDHDFIIGIQYMIEHGIIRIT